MQFIQFCLFICPPLHLLSFLHPFSRPHAGLIILIEDLLYLENDIIQHREFNETWQR